MVDYRIVTSFWDYENEESFSEDYMLSESNLVVVKEQMLRASKKYDDKASRDIACDVVDLYELGDFHDEEGCPIDRRHLLTYNPREENFEKVD